MASAYASVCSYVRIRLQMLIYVRGTLCYKQRPNIFLDMFKIYQRMQACRIYVTHTYAYATNTFVKPCSREAGLKVVRIRSFFWNLHTLSKICIRNAYAIVWLHLKAALLGCAISELSLDAQQLLSATYTIYTFQHMSIILCVKSVKCLCSKLVELVCDKSFCEMFVLQPSGALGCLYGGTRNALMFSCSAVR